MMNIELYDKYRKLYIISNTWTTDIIGIKVHKNKYLALYVIDYGRNENKIYSLDEYNISCLDNNIIYDNDLNKLIKIRNDIIKICGENTKINYVKLCKIYDINYENLNMYNIDYELLLMNKEKYLSQLYHKIFIITNIDMIIDIKKLITLTFCDLILDE